MALSDIYGAFSFTPNGGQTLLLSGALEASEDELTARLATFEYLKRDGAELEPLGAGAAKFSFRVVLMGMAPLYPGSAPMSAGERYTTIVKAQRGQPRGLLNHPQLGRWQVGWTKIRGSAHPQRAIDTYEVSLDFVEDQLDQALAVEQRPTPGSQANQVVSAYSILTAAMAARFAGPQPLFAAATAAATMLASTAATFVAAALDAAQSTTPDPSLLQQVGAVLAARDSFLRAIAATLAYTLEPDASLTPYRHQAYMVHAYCLLLLDAVREQQPVLITYVVPTAMSLDQVLVALYGSDASSHFNEALSLNPHVSPLWIPQGTVLTVVAPQVRQ